jgi:formylmethanofuran dehydrogenase subunit B
MTEPASGGATHRDVVCPFCGLGCDDVALTVTGTEVTPAEGACGRAAKLFSRSGDAAPAPRVNGREASLEVAIEAAAELISDSRAPVFAGLGADVDGVRALIRLAGRRGASLDHYASTGLFRNISTSQRKGWIATTLAEVRNRCDVMVVVGPDPSEAFHRLYERVLPKTGVFVEGRRTVVFLGGEPTAEARAQLTEVEIEIIAVPEGGLVDAMSRLAALVGGVVLTDASGPDLAPLAKRLLDARYGVLAWNAGALGEDGDLVVERAASVVDALNVTTRGGCLPLAGRDNLIGANQTMLWNVGFPLRTGFPGGVANHDQLIYAGPAALESADAALWVSAFRPEPPPAFDGRLVALAHPETAFEREPDVFIPVGQPGLDHAGHIFRTDTVVCLPLRKHREAGLPSVAEIVNRLGGARL